MADAGRRRGSNPYSVGRRTLLRLGLAGIAIGVAGCTGGSRETTLDPTRAAADVIVGPTADLRFEPARLTIQPGETVLWYFASETHNVSGVPAHHARIDIPAGAESFASYEGDSPADTEPRGATYRHNFTVPGRYVYVCIPHAEVGMVGEIVVEE